MGGQAALGTPAELAMRIRLLGGFHVAVDGVPVSSGWRLRKAKTLVKLLALADGHRLHRDRLVEMLWDGLEPSAANNNLHQTLHAARRALTVSGREPAQLLALEDDVVQLCPAGTVDVDVDAFAALAARALTADRPADYRAALARYEGELLPEDRFADWAATHRRRLHDLHAALTAGLSRALLREDRADEAVRMLEPLAADRPTDEPLQRLLMAALDSADRRWDALAAYERLRRTLADEVAADPQPATRDLYRRLLAGTGAGASIGRHNLPSAATSFVGRRRALGELVTLLDGSRLVTLTGPGGAGKTRLAVEVARRRTGSDAHPDGVWMVELQGLRDGRLVPASIAASLSLPLSGTRPTTAALVDQLASQQMLLLLDNCEHLLPACGEVVRTLLADCPGVTVLATSREPLHVAGEVAWRVPSLELPESGDGVDVAAVARHESVQLFVERARAALPGFTLDEDNARDVARICTRLDGIPLALELAAARVAHLAPAQLAGRLDDALTMLAVRLAGTPDRQATLRGALDWSHALLDDDERAVFRRASVFASGFGLDAAEEVCAGELDEPVVSVLSRLVDKSLVIADTDNTETRYRLHEFVRQYAADRLAASGEADDRRRRHAQWYAERAEAFDPDVGTPVVGEPDPWFDVERDNLRLALTTSLAEMPDRALRTAVAMWRFWMGLGRHAEGSRWLTDSLAACPTRSALRARALFATAVFDVRLARGWRLMPTAAEIVDVYAELGDPAGIAHGLHEQALLAWLAGEWAEIDRFLASAEEAARDIPTVRASHDHLRALIALSRGDTVAARHLFEGAIAALEEVPRDAAPFFSVCSPAFAHGDLDGIPTTVFEETMLAGRRVGREQARGFLLTNLAAAARVEGRLDEAVSLLDRALRVFTTAGDLAGQAQALVQRGYVLWTLHEPRAARSCFESAIELRASFRDQRGTAIAQTGLALAEALAGNTERARTLAEEACEVLGRSGDLPGASGAANNLAVVELLCDRPAEARAALERWLSFEGVPGNHRPTGWQHASLAALRLRDGDPAGAAAGLDAARSVFDLVGDRRGQAVVERLQVWLKPRRTAAKRVQSARS